MNVLLLLLTASLSATPDTDAQSVVVVVGAPGAGEYEQPFRDWATRWEVAARQAEARHTCIGLGASETDSDKQLLVNCLKAENVASTEPVWLVLIGHGTFDSRLAKFNLRGPDVTAKELVELLKPFQRPLAIVNCSSSSGPFINRLSGDRRIVVTATKSGFEHNYARFGDHISTAIADETADLDKDGQTSLLEAFLAASARVNEFYEQESRLATEHSLLDDNGDGLGTPSDWYQGVRATRSAKDGALPDGPLANQFCLVRSQQERNMPAEIRAQRDAFELEIARLRENKKHLLEDEYYLQLEAVLLKLAYLYEQLDELSDDE